MKAAPPTVHHRQVQVDGISVFYREAGPADAPVVLLLHGFPSSSHQYRRLIPFLADRFRVIAPDYPGFGRSGAPARETFAYTFEALTRSIRGLLETLGVARYALYVMDYGAPVGLRLALGAPDRVTALIAQNGTPYAEGFGAFWDPMKAFWANNDPGQRQAMRQFLAREATTFLYTFGAQDPTRVDPAAIDVDQAFLDRPGNDEIQLDLFYDNRANLVLLGDMQGFVRDTKAPVMVLWGEKDPILDVAGAHAFARDRPDAEIRLFPTGHCALEDQFEAMAPMIHDFYVRALLGA